MRLTQVNVDVDSENETGSDTGDCTATLDEQVYTLLGRGPSTGSSAKVIMSSSLRFSTSSKSASAGERV